MTKTKEQEESDKADKTYMENRWWYRTDYKPVMIKIDARVIVPEDKYLMFKRIVIDLLDIEKKGWYRSYEEPVKLFQYYLSLGVKHKTLLNIRKKHLTRPYRTIFDLLEKNGFMRSMSGSVKNIYVDGSDFNHTCIESLIDPGSDIFLMQYRFKVNPIVKTVKTFDYKDVKAKRVRNKAGKMVNKRAKIVEREILIDIDRGEDVRRVKKINKFNRKHTLAIDSDRYIMIYAGKHNGEHTYNRLWAQDLIFSTDMTRKMKSDKCIHDLSTKAMKQIRRYGRLYASYQTVRRDFRPLFTIDNEPTIEPDFKCMQPTILYAMEGIGYTEDAYDIFDEISDGSVLWNLQRSIAKALMLKLLGSKSRDSCEKGFRLYIRKNRYRLNKLPGFATMETDEIMDNLFERFFKKHERIWHHFFNEATAYLQLIDSDIMLDIQEECVDNGIPSYSIHDSVIVKKKDLEKVREIMLRVYTSHMGFAITITSK